jgi:hypothetical protein
MKQGEQQLTEKLRQEHNVYEQLMLTQKYSAEYRVPVDVKARKSVAKALKLPAAQTVTASNSWTSPPSGSSAEGNRASSPVGQRPDSTDAGEFWQLCHRYTGSLGLDFDPFDPARDKRFTAADAPLAHAAGSPYEVSNRVDRLRLEGSRLVRCEGRLWPCTRPRIHDSFGCPGHKVESGKQ